MWSRTVVASCLCLLSVCGRSTVYANADVNTNLKKGSGGGTNLHLIVLDRGTVLPPCVAWPLQPHAFIRTCHVFASLHVYGL